MEQMFRRFEQEMTVCRQGKLPAASWFGFFADALQAPSKGRAVWVVAILGRLLGSQTAEKPLWDLRDRMHLWGDRALLGC